MAKEASTPPSRSAGRTPPSASSPAVPTAPHPAPHPGSHAGPAQVWFHRTELNRILSVYGRMVAAGDWRDYAIDALKDRAVFSVFRRASDVPLYRIEKRPALARKQGAYCVVAPGGQILKRGHDLAQVLTVFDRKRFRLVH